MFFFFKQKTAYEMRISDWSSDVCSSDLPEVSAIDKPAGFSAEFIACGEADRSCPSSEEVARIAGNIGGCHLLRAFAVAEIEIAQHAGEVTARPEDVGRSEEHTSELQSLMRISYAVFCLKQTHNKQLTI